MSVNWQNLRLYDNVLDPMTPEWWAEEALLRFEKNLVASQLFNRDYEDRFQEAGDVVNVHSVSDFETKRKTPGENISLQDAVSLGQQVKLNQHLYTAFSVEDREIQLGFPNLIEKFLEPAVQAIAEDLDFYCLLEQYNWVHNSGGRLGESATYNALVDTSTKMHNNKAPREGRFMVVGPESEGDLLKTDKLTEFRMTGQQPSDPILNGIIARGAGFWILQSQNVPTIPQQADTSEATVDGNQPAGTKTLVVNALTSYNEIKEGQWILVAGDDTPQQVTDDADETDTDIKITPGLKRPVSNDAVVTIFDHGTVNHGAGYDAGYDGEIITSGFTQMPHRGQGVTFGDSTKVYGIWSVSGNNITLSQPLEADVSNGTHVNPLPWGTYNMAMRSPAATLVNRPMPLPRGGAVGGAIATNNNLSLRVIMSYDHLAMKTIVSIDSLFGLKTLLPNQGAVLLA